MKRITVVFAVFAIMAILVAGCIFSQPPLQPAAPVPSQVPTTPVTTATVPLAVSTHLAGTWVVIKMGIQGGTVVIDPTTDITLTVAADGTLSGYGGCNNYNGPYTVTGKTTEKGYGITIGPLISTQKYCEIYSRQETMYLDILGKSMAYSVNGNKLSITATTGDALIYQTQASLVSTSQYPHPA